MKKLVTHLNPHLDDIVGMWLFARLHPDFGDAQLLFKAKGEIETLSGEEADSDPSVIYIGTGMGKFDEHKGDLNDCATTLVWKYLKEEGYAPKDVVEQGAYEKLVDYAFLEDTAKLETSDYHQFMLSGIVGGHLKKHEDSLKTTEFTFLMLDGLLEVLKETALAEKEFEGRVEFDTKWGKGAAFVSSGKETARTAYKHGFVVTASIHKEKGYRVIGAQSSSSVDLTEAYQKAKELEPEADWYLHHSKRLLICGSDVAENKNLSNLSLEQLVSLVKI